MEQLSRSMGASTYPSSIHFPTPYTRIVITKLHHRPARNRSLAITSAQTGGKQVTTGAETHESNTEQLCGSPLALNRERRLKRGWTGIAEALAWSRPGAMRGNKLQRPVGLGRFGHHPGRAMHKSSHDVVSRRVACSFTIADRLWRLRIPTASIAQRDLDRHRQSACITPTSSRKTAGLKTILAHYEASKLSRETSISHLG
jgi:hypothetical protein